MALDTLYFDLKSLNSRLAVTPSESAYYEFLYWEKATIENRIMELENEG